MIRIKNADLLQNKIKFIYNPLSELSLALDVLSHPEYNRLHAEWAGSILSRFSRKEKQQLVYFESMLDGYLNIDLHFDFLGFDYSSTEPEKDCLQYLNDGNNSISNLPQAEFEQLTSFLTFMWSSYIFPAVSEHITEIRKKISAGYRILENEGYRQVFSNMTERIAVNPNGDMRIEKKMDSDFDANELDSFFIELSVFAFPYLVVSDRHRDGFFFISWDVPFKSNNNIYSGIEELSTSAFALSDKSRLRILLLLSNCPMTQKDLSRLMGFAKSTISRHVNILITADLVRQEGTGRNVLLELNREALSSFSGKIAEWLN